MAEICSKGVVIWLAIVVLNNAVQGVGQEQVQNDAQFLRDCNVSAGGWNPCVTIFTDLNVNDLYVPPTNEQNYIAPTTEEQNYSQEDECQDLINTFDEDCFISNQINFTEIQQQCCQTASQIQQGQCLCGDLGVQPILQTWEILCSLSLYSSCENVSNLVPSQTNQGTTVLLQEFDTDNSSAEASAEYGSEGINNVRLQIQTATEGQQSNVIKSPPEILVPQANVCVIQEHANAGGSLLEETVALDAGECCAKCEEMQGCNAFVFCPKEEGCRSIYGYPGARYDHEMCHLKQQMTIAYGANPVYWYRGVDTDFTSGFIFQDSLESPTHIKGCVNYFTQGPNQVAIVEGSKILAPNGDDFLNVKDAKECVTSCEAINKQCNQVCCDSAAYHPVLQQCWLKYGAGRETQLNENGWQTFYRSEGVDADDDDAVSRTVFNTFSICEDDIKGGLYTDAYVSYGVGQLALSEGSFLAMADGSYSKKVSLRECAQECQKLPVCDALTYTAKAATCYLRRGSAKFDTISMKGGQTTYWRVQKSIADTMCSQQQGWYCLYCGGYYNDTCQYY
eukprot:TRINITY_DN144_c0_g1_i2.p1 TRINITY_DN144_c0_g1~~TRINITY_DN144_c0_g1_i2.p1  ORF type:complete len:601 (+),score=85.75 TRINITY_DN144_c0_g1_i2:116-1804(+)